MPSGRVLTGLHGHGGVDGETATWDLLAKLKKKRARAHRSDPLLPRSILPRPSDGDRNHLCDQVRVADHKVERVIDLKDISLTGFYGSSLSLTPDDQPVMTRDSGSMEIFTLDWRTS